MARQPQGRVLVRAPSNLGLRPLRPGHVPGTWRAPQALTEAGLVEALAPTRILDLPQPPYETGAQSGTRIRNGLGIRAFGLALAQAVAIARQASELAFVIGGDCSILMGALAGVRRCGPVSLVHIDGHSDFRHPGNFDMTADLGSAGGMDLALATGRGEPLLVEWPEVSAPLVPDAQVVQIGEREGRDPDFAWPDVNDSGITRIDVFTAREIGPAAVLERTFATLNRTDWPYWVHLDVDVLDQAVLPAVDSPGSPGIDPADLVVILRGLLADAGFLGLTLTIYDPDLDPQGEGAQRLVSLLRAVNGRPGSDERPDR